MNKRRYYSCRIRLEKLEQKTWLLVILAKFLSLLAVLIR
jgi:hypothetical protein